MKREEKIIVALMGCSHALSHGSLLIFPTVLLLLQKEFSLGYLELARVVREHVRLEDEVRDPRPLREAEVVNYADKRVLHTRVVTVTDRFTDLRERYGRTPEALVRIAAMEVRTRALEEKLFAPLDLSPLDLLKANGDSRFKVQG